jgi:hypothetical protein
VVELEIEDTNLDQWKGGEINMDRKPIVHYENPMPGPRPLRRQLFWIILVLIVISISGVLLGDGYTSFPGAVPNSTPISTPSALRVLPVLLGVLS